MKFLVCLFTVFRDGSFTAYQPNKRIFCHKTRLWFEELCATVNCQELCVFHSDLGTTPENSVCILEQGSSESNNRICHLYIVSARLEELLILL